MITMALTDVAIDDDDDEAKDSYCDYILLWLYHHDDVI